LISKKIISVFAAIVIYVALIFYLYPKMAKSYHPAFAFIAGLRGRDMTRRNDTVSIMKELKNRKN